MSPRALIDGRIADAISIWDRGLLYGDGVFRTVRLQAGTPVWWLEHLNKLAEDCARLGLRMPAIELWQADLDRLAGDNANGVVKLIVTRGTGARGYRPESRAKATRIVLLSAMPEIDLAIKAQGAQVRICQLRLGHQPHLAGIKHLNRLEQVLAQNEWHNPDIHEGLLFDEDGRLVSGTKSNVFLVRAGTLITPNLSRCGVAGVTRARLMKIAHDAGLPGGEVDDIDLKMVLAADELLLCNSLIGLWRVARLEDRSWHVPVLYSYLSERLHA